MKKLTLASILILILATSLVKNSTKEIEDKTFNINENIRSLKVELDELLLEYNFLSSPEKLSQYQFQYFENSLKKIDIIKKIKKIKATLLNSIFKFDLLFLNEKEFSYSSKIIFSLFSLFINLRPIYQISYF